MTKLKESFNCLVGGCEREFSTHRGLTIHRSRKHPLSSSFCCRCDVELTPENWYKGYTRGYQRKYCKTCRNKEARKYYHGSSDVRNRVSIHAKEVRQSLRQRIFNVLGDKCKFCGFVDFRALQIDHVNGNGHEEKRQFGGGYSTVYLRHVLEKVLAKSSDYQLLCANCNQIKVHTNCENQ